MPTRVMPAAMPVVKAIAPLDKEETEQRKILAVPVARHGLDPVTTETVVASALVAMVPLTPATTSVPAVAVAITEEAEVEVTASLRARLAAAAAAVGQVSRPQDSLRGGNVSGRAIVITSSRVDLVVKYRSAIL